MLLLHLRGGKPLSMPYYLHKSLSKMVEFLRKKRNPETTLYHKGLIMMVISEELNRLGVSWSTFMGSKLSKPKMRTLPPKKRLEGVTIGYRRSTRVSQKVLGMTTIEEEDTES
jgi:hypothetical protein